MPILVWRQSDGSGHSERPRRSSQDSRFSIVVPDLETGNPPLLWLCCCAAIVAGTEPHLEKEIKR